jgi:hypothetical protein
MTGKKQIPRAKTALGMTASGALQHAVKSCPDTANIRANGVPGVFSVTNELRYTR